MTRRETPFVTDGDLIIVTAFITGPLGTTDGRFVLDTGAVLTTMTHELADSIGVQRARWHQACPRTHGHRQRGRLRPERGRVRRARIHHAELLDPRVRPRLR